jgi:hypothetical protein
MKQFLGYVIEFPDGKYLAGRTPTGEAITSGCPCDCQDLSYAAKFSTQSALRSAILKFKEHGLHTRLTVYRLYDLGAKYRLLKYGS